MAKIRDVLQESTSSSKPKVDVGEYEKRKAEAYNAEQGNLNLQDGYNCKKCQNRGMFMRIEENGGMYRERFTPCECMKVRASINRMKSSGLEGVIKRLTFDSFKTNEPYQKAMYDLAKRYTEQSTDEWLFFGGAVGSGKTHLCTAVCRDFLLKGQQVIYVLWAEMMQELKAKQFDDYDYDKLMVLYKSCDVLYIDDYFKPVVDGSGYTATDVKLTYDIINSRYVQRKRTIITSERLNEELLEIDEAVQSRIVQMCGEYKCNIARDKDRNYRIKGGKTI